MPVRSKCRKCKPRWTVSLKPTATLASPSAQKRQRWCSSQPQANSPSSHRSQWTERCSRQSSPSLTYQHPISDCHHRCRDQQQNLQGKCHIQKTAGESMGEEKNLPWDQTKSLQSFKSLRPHHSSLWCRNLDSVQNTKKILNHCHFRCLHSFLHIHWQDKIPNTEVLKRASLPSITTITRNAQLRWAGHVSRMHDDHIPKQLFYGELCHGKRTVRGQCKCCKDSLKVSLNEFDISTESWESLVSDRPCWRRIVTQGAITAEEHRRWQKPPSRTEKSRTQGQKRSATSTPTHHGPTCGKSFLAQMGPISHLRTHRGSPTDWLCSWSFSTTKDEQLHAPTVHWCMFGITIVPWISGKGLHFYAEYCVPHLKLFGTATPSSTSCRMVHLDCSTAVVTRLAIHIKVSEANQFLLYHNSDICIWDIFIVNVTLITRYICCGFLSHCKVNLLLQ